MEFLKQLIAIIIVLGVATGLAYGIGMNSRLIWDNFHLLWFLFILSFAIQIIAFVFAIVFNTESFFDLIGSLTYISLALIGLFVNNGPSWEQYVAAGMIIVWAARLGSFLFMRILKSGGDSRFEEIKQSAMKFFVTWLLQGLWVAITASALFVVISKPAQSGGVDVLEIVGLVIWAFGLIFETVADYQKSAFKEQQQNKGKFINVGLWSISRHPNYFGEITLWLGAALYAIPSLVTWEFLSMISPVFVCILIVFVSGIPMLEKKADERWGQDQDYIEYKRNTPVLVPFTCGDKVHQHNSRRLAENNNSIEV